MSSEQPTTVLVVDDDPVSLEFAVAVYQSLECDTFTARTGLAALDVAGKYRIDLVVLDIQLPGMGGIELLQQIRKSVEHQYLPVFVALTGETRPSRHARFLQSGCSRVLTKPATAAQLLHCLELAGCESARDKATGAYTGSPSLQQAAALQALDGDRELLARFQQTFGRELNTICPVIDDHIMQHNFEEAARLVHRLNAAAGYCGALALQHCCKCLESALRNSTVAEIAQHYMSFLAQCERLSYRL